MRIMQWLRKIWLFYYEGFKGMTVGKTLWLIIFIKFFVIFAILKLFFFQPVLKGSDAEKAEVVRKSMMRHHPAERDGQ